MSLFSLPDEAPHKPLLEWGISMYKCLGLDETSIFEAMPGVIPRPEGHSRPANETRTIDDKRTPVYAMA